MKTIKINLNKLPIEAYYHLLMMGYLAMEAKKAKRKAKRRAKR